MRDGFIKVAAATPSVRVADCAYNAQQTIALMQEAARQSVKVLAFPELGLTGYTCADLFLQPVLLKGAEKALGQVVAASEDLDLFVEVSLPLRINDKLYSCAVAVCHGEILGVVPKTHIPNYTEFYEARWFTSGAGVSTYITLCGQEDIYVDAQQIFRCENIPALRIGMEICEDLWVPTPPSNFLCTNGATVILNPSASDEIVCKDSYRRSLVTGQSGRLVCAYLYADAGDGESSTDLVYAGHNLIAENGSLLAERRFETGLTVSEIDVDKLLFERQRMTTYPVADADCFGATFTLEETETQLTRSIAPNPFVPSSQMDREARCQEIFTMVSLGLKKRLQHTWAKTAVIGLSGGLDSTLALLITHNAMKMLGRPATDIICVTMPCFGTTDRTRDNATKLAECLGTSFRRVDIGVAVMQHFQDIGHDPADHSVTYENCQARERTQVLMDIANKTGGLVIGTGDLSEMALGWSTYNGDHMSMYAVNCSIPKTLVRHLTKYVSDINRASAPELSEVLDDILDTPVSPELLPPEENGQIAQKTEDLVGPYELHDFFLYYGIRFAFPPKKVFRLANYAFQGTYEPAFILKWEKNFYHRFFVQQFKRSCIPDGPKVGSVTLSPRGDWRMPSDAVAALWKAELEELEV